MQFDVYGTVTLTVACRVTAKNADDAIDAAYEEFKGIRSYIGNGKVVGVSGPNESIQNDGEVEWGEAVPTSR